jgi:spermidine synthase
MLSTLVFVFPTILMGGTFPAITQAFLHTNKEAGKWTGFFYGLNTIGAALGAFSAGFFLIYQFGLFKVNTLTALINLSIGLFVLVIFGFQKTGYEEESINETSSQNKFFVLGTVCLFISGISTMIYEVLWTRFLTLVLGSSTYAFSVVLITFLFGLAIGSLLASKIIDRFLNPMLWAFIFQILLCIFIFINLPLQDRLPLLFYDFYRKVHPSFLNIQLLQFCLAGFVILIPTLLIGASFPCFMKISLGYLKEWKRKVGFLYAMNSFGNVIGASLGSLMLLPLLGLEKGIRTAIGLQLLIILGLALNVSSEKIIKGFLSILILISGTALAWSPEWNLKILTAGISVYAKKYSDLGIDQKKLTQEISNSKTLFSKEGWTSHVTVRKYAGVRSLLINGKADGSDGQDLQTELLSAHLPLLLHGHPKKVFVLGLGTGITLRAVEKHPVDQIDCVEIEKRVVEASDYFRKSNHDSLSDPRVNLTINDARHVLSNTNQKYDVMISEPSNPWLAGIGSLYTIEMFRQMEKHLEPGGIVCQWVHYYNMSDSDLKTVVRTFQSVFPNTSLWGQAHLSDLLLIGFKENKSYRILSSKIKEKKIDSDLRSIGLANAQVLEALRWLSPKELKEYAGGGPLNTDDHPILEFSAPRSLYRDTMADNLKELLSFRQERQKPYEKAMTHFMKAMIHFYEKDASSYLEALTQAVQEKVKWKQLISFYEESIYQEAELYFKKQQDQEALELLLKSMPYLKKSAKIHYTIGYLYQKQEDWSTAKDFYSRAIKIDPKFAQAHNNLGTVSLHFGEGELAYECFKKALEINPEYLEARLNLAYSLLGQKALEGAELEFRLCLKLNPNLSSAHNGLGVALAMQKKHLEAMQEFKKALELDPGNTEAMKNLERVVKKLDRPTS